VADLEETAGVLAPRLIAYGLARTGCRHAAEDIAQDALTALVRRWRQTGPPDSADAFVFAIAKRRVGRFLVRRALTAPLDAVRGVARDEPSAAQSYECRTELAVVLTAIRALPRSERDVLLLRVVGELTFPDIARLMHTTPAAAKMRVSRARRKLAGSLPEYFHGRIHTA